MDATFIQARIDSTKLAIVAYEGALTALATDGIQSYQLDTGQSSQRVTRLDLEWINKAVDTLYNRCATLEARLNGSNILIGRPRF